MCLIMNVNITRMFYMAAALVLFASCKTANQLTYFENVDNLPESEQALDYSTRIKPADELTITVNALVPEAAAPYNLSAVSIMKSGETSESSTPTKIQTYIVDKDGNISFPILGEVHAEGKTTKELANYLRSRIEKEIDNPIVNVQLVNFRVNVLGAVLEPGSIEVKSERFSVLDALAAAGDMTVQGKRDNVLLIRDNNGKREFHRLNLKDAGIVDSPYFYMQQNDVIYVEPSDVAAENAEYNQNNSFKISVISTVVSAVSVVTSLLIALLINNNK